MNLVAALSVLIHSTAVRIRDTTWAAALRDVLVVSVRGARSAATHMADGDFDGDRAWICWDPRVLHDVTPVMAAKTSTAVGATVPSLCCSRVAVNCKCTTVPPVDTSRGGFTTLENSIQHTHKSSLGALGVAQWYKHLRRHLWRLHRHAQAIGVLSLAHESCADRLGADHPKALQLAKEVKSCMAAEKQDKEV